MTAYLCYSIEPDIPARLAMQYRSLYQFLLNKWYFDELYDRLFVRNAFSLGEGLWKTGDGKIIDGLGPDGIAAATRELSREASRLQTGYRLSLRLRDADRRRRAGHLVPAAAVSGIMAAAPSPPARRRDRSPRVRIAGEGGRPG